MPDFLHDAKINVRLKKINFKRAELFISKQLPEGQPTAVEEQ